MMTEILPRVRKCGPHNPIRFVSSRGYRSVRRTDFACFCISNSTTGPCAEQFNATAVPTRLYFYIQVLPIKRKPVVVSIIALLVHVDQRFPLLVPRRL